MSKSEIPHMFPTLAKAIERLYLTTAGSYRASMPTAQRDAYVLELAELPEQDVLKAVQRIIDDPEQRSLATVAQIKAKLPGHHSSVDTGLDAEKCFCWTDYGAGLVTIGNPKSVPVKERLPIVLHSKQCGDASWRELAQLLGVTEAAVDEAIAAETARLRALKAIKDAPLGPDDPFSDEALARSTP